MNPRHRNGRRYWGMTGVQFAIVLFLAALVLMIFAFLFFLVRSTSNLEEGSPSLLAYISLSVEQLPDNTVLVRGSTSLPDGTIIMVTVEDYSGEYLAQDKVTALNGRFVAGPFSSHGYGLEEGKYRVEALMPYPSTQPESVRKIIGEQGEYLAGNQVFFDNGVLVRAVKTFNIVVPTLSPLPSPTPTVTPVKILLSGGDIGKGWSNGERRISLLSVYRTDSLEGIKPFGEWHGGYKGGFTQFLVVELKLERLKPGYEDYYMTAFWLWAYTDDGYREYQADQYLYKSSKVMRVYYQHPIETAIAFEVTPSSHNFILCYEYGIAVAPSEKIVSGCGPIGSEFKFGDGNK